MKEEEDECFFLEQFEKSYLFTSTPHRHFVSENLELGKERKSIKRSSNYFARRKK